MPYRRLDAAAIGNCRKRSFWPAMVAKLPSASWRRAREAFDNAAVPRLVGLMILLTGAAGFVGFHVAHALVARGHQVVGIDDLNPYYAPALKHARLAVLAKLPGFRFVAGDIAADGALAAALPLDEVTGIVHLAAQAGVRYSITAPFAYERANLAGHLSVLEYARAAKKLKHLVYASSSSVYGDRSDGPFRETDRCDTPASLYAATKKSCELMSETYARLYGIPQTGLRFFTVYGPWGRPDMAYWMFTKAISHGETIKLFGEGKLSRDFTFIGDMAPTIETILTKPPQGAPPHAVYNLGNSRPNSVMELVAAVEDALGREAIKELSPMQPGDVSATFADHTAASRDFGFAPKTKLVDGIASFVEWYRQQPDEITNA